MIQEMEPNQEVTKMNAIWMVDARRFPEMQASADMDEARHEAAFAATRPVLGPPAPPGYWYSEEFNSFQSQHIRDAERAALEALIIRSDRGFTNADGHVNFGA